MFESIIAYGFYGVLAIGTLAALAGGVASVDEREHLPAAAGFAGFVVLAFLLSLLMHATYAWFVPGAASNWIMARLGALGFGGWGGFIVADAVLRILVATTPPPSTMALVLAKENGTSTATSQHLAGSEIITTAFETAALVRTPLQAAATTRATDAQVAALRDAERLALTAASAAEAEAKALSAMLRRADLLTSLRLRQDAEEDAYNQQNETNIHLKELVQLAREKEKYDATRQATEAQHSLEAARIFKDLKFELGRIRMLARQQDAEVDSKTAEAAVVKIACELSKVTERQNPDLNTWLDERIARVGRNVEDGEADGADSGELRTELAILQRLKQMARAA